MWREVLNRAILNPFDKARLFIAGPVIDSFFLSSVFRSRPESILMFSANILEIYVSSQYITCHI